MLMLTHVTQLLAVNCHCTGLASCSCGVALHSKSFVGCSCIIELCENQTSDQLTVQPTAGVATSPHDWAVSWIGLQRCCVLQEDGRPPKSCSLATGVSETLKVSPARRLLNIMMTGKHGAAKKVGNVINLHFEGNWMPIQVCTLSVL